MKDVRTLIYKAQYYSDRAKGIELLDIPYENGAYSCDSQHCYRMKDINILHAIRQINKEKNSGFSFYVTVDNSGIADFLVYFNVFEDGKRKQISFHSFNVELKKYLKGSTSHKTKWDRKSSRKTCESFYK